MEPLTYRGSNSTHATGHVRNSACHVLPLVSVTV
jgi:hypothetical protein